MTAPPGSTRFPSITARPADKGAKQKGDRPPGNAAAPGAGNTEGEQENNRAGWNQDTADLAAERTFIGARLWCPVGDGREADALVRPEDFTDPFLADLYRVIRRMADEGVPIDSTTLPPFARSHGLVKPGPNQVMLASRVAELASDAPVGCTVVFHAGIVAEQGIRRRAADELHRLAAIYLQADIDAIPGELEKVTASLRADLDRIGGGR